MPKVLHRAQGQFSSCLLCISMWLSPRHLKLHLSDTEPRVFPSQKYLATAVQLIPQSSCQPSEGFPHPSSLLMSRFINA